MALEPHEKALIVAACGLFFQRQTGGGLMLKLHQAINHDIDSGMRSEFNGNIEHTRVDNFENAVKNYREHVLKICSTMTS